jgi:colanic acid biosynthesis glycosyl transferase WcaI
MKKNVIFVHSLFYPDFSAGSQMLSDLAFYLSNSNFNVSVITSRRSYDNLSKSLPKYEIINKVKIYRKWSSSFGRKTFIGRLLDYLTLEISIIFGIFRLTRKNDLVVLLTDPPLLNVVTSPIILLKGGLVINWLQDLFPEVAVGANIFSKDSLINKIITKLRNNALKKASMNIVIGKHMFNYLVDLGLSSNKISRIPNWANGKAIKPVPINQNKIRKNWGLENKFVIGYSGNLGKAHDTTTIIDAIEDLKDNNNIHFLFIGGGSGMRKLIKYVNEMGLKNVMFKPYQNRDLLHLSLGVANLHWITLDPKMESFIVPSKIYGILAAAKPIIFLGDKQGELAEVIDKIGCGKAIEIGDSKKLVLTIKEYSSDIKYIEKLGLKGRYKFEEKYDFNISAKIFLNLFENLN